MPMRQHTSAVYVEIYILLKKQSKNQLIFKQYAKYFSNRRYYTVSVLNT